MADKEKTKNEQQLLRIAEILETNNRTLSEGQEAIREGIASLQTKIQTLQDAAKSPEAHEVEDLSQELNIIEQALNAQQEGLKAQEKLASQFRGAASVAKQGGDVVDVSKAIDAKEEGQGRPGLDAETGGTPGGQAIDATPANDPNSQQGAGAGSGSGGSTPEGGEETNLTRDGVTPLSPAQGATAGEPTDDVLGGDRG